MSPILSSFTTSFGHQPVIRTPIVPRLEDKKYGLNIQYQILNPSLMSLARRPDISHIRRHPRRIRVDAHMLNPYRSSPRVQTWF